jgi:hypothetical protein
MSRSPVHQSPTRGAASVEMAICMLVIVPVFLYALFLDDLLRYSLDVQEATVSTVWDYTVQDYAAEGKFSPATVQHHARLMFCDHESGKGRYNERGQDGTYKDCEEEDHHQGTAVTAHVCWLNDQGKAKQVTCEGPDGSVGSVEAGKLYTSYASSFNQGGLVHCSARAVVENYLLPKHFLPQFSDDKEVVDLSKKMWKGGSYHQNSRDGDDGNAYFTQEQHMSILVDTWALTKPATVRPGDKEGQLYERVALLYTEDPAQAQMRNASRSFFSRAGQSLLSPKFLPPQGGDDLGKPNLAIRPHKADEAVPDQEIKQEDRTSSYFNTEWKDWDQNRNSKTFEKRGTHYLGCKRVADCG